MPIHVGADLQEVEGEVELVDHGAVDGHAEQDEDDGGPLVRPPLSRHSLLQLPHWLHEPFATSLGEGFSLRKGPRTPILRSDGATDEKQQEFKKPRLSFCQHYLQKEQEHFVVHHNLFVT